MPRLMIVTDGFSGGTAKIHSYTDACALQIWCLWKSGKKKTIMERKL